MINIFNNQDLNTFETLQNARKDLIGEIEAIITYDNHLHSTNIPVARQTWQDIMHEEIIHVGELLALINYLDPTQKEYVEKGIAEFNERIK